MTRDADTVHGVMSSPVVTVGPGDPVREAIRKMLEHDIGSVVVEDNGQPVGVFTERDVTRRVLDDGLLLDRPVTDVMSSTVVTTDVSVEVIEAFDLMNAKQVRRLPVVADGRLVGIVTEGDLRRWVGRVAKE